MDGQLQGEQDAAKRFVALSQPWVDQMVNLAKITAGYRDRITFRHNKRVTLRAKRRALC